MHCIYIGFLYFFMYFIRKNAMDMDMGSVKVRGVLLLIYILLEWAVYNVRDVSMHNVVIYHWILIFTFFIYWCYIYFYLLIIAG
jgi:hypothetical protein